MAREIVSGRRMCIEISLKALVAFFEVAQGSDWA